MAPINIDVKPIFIFSEVGLKRKLAPINKGIIPMILALIYGWFKGWFGFNFKNPSMYTEGNKSKGF